MPTSNPQVRARVPVAFAVAAYALLLFFTVFTLGPLIWVVMTSLKSQQEIMAGLLSPPRQWSFANYEQAWDLGNFTPLFVNSFLYCIVTTVVVVLLAMSAGFAFAKIPSKLTTVWYAFFLLGLLVTVSSSIVPIFVAETLLHLTNTRIGIIIPYIAFNLSFGVYLAAAYVRSINNEIVEAAMIDGADYVRIYFRIVLPMSRPIMTTIAIFTFFACWVEYVLVYMMSSDDSIRTIQVGVSLLKGFLAFNYGFLFAAIVIATVPLLILYALFRRQLQAGFSMGAVKG
jgi:raffinose/stachyose/melibiose transport system permease protein